MKITVCFSQLCNPLDKSVKALLAESHYPRDDNFIFAGIIHSQESVLHKKPTAIPPLSV